MVSEVSDGYAAAAAASKSRRRPGRRSGTQPVRAQESCDNRSALRPCKGSGAPPGLKPARAQQGTSGDDASRRAFRPYHALAVPRGPRPLGTNSAEGSKKPATTAMLRNIPNKYTQNSLLEEIHEAGFTDTYDFFYLPMDVHNRANVGYAFINFLSPDDMTRFTVNFTDYVFQKHPSLKIARVSPAHIQGLVENLRHFSNRAVTWSRNSQYRPIVRYQGVHRDLCELLAELPLSEPHEGKAAAAMAPDEAAPSCEEEVAVASDPLEPTSSLNPKAAEFVPLSDPAGVGARENGQQAWGHVSRRLAGCSGSTGRTSLRPDAGIFVPQAMLTMPEIPEMGMPTDMDMDTAAMLAMQEMHDMGLASDMDMVVPPPGLEGAYGFDGDFSAALFGFDDRFFECGEPQAPTPPAIGEEASEPFTLAKQGLQDAVTRWLREGRTAPSAGGSSSTRSSSNGTTPRSVGTPAIEEKGSAEAS
mmetsp:Transcript_141542/g.394439  ORF Transcript_141542/g.394439 Transcript_141542/m.394439 type:complete len:473 (+) Transcript_141542:153-1571(+)